jgi:photosystem II stability/assembly factor-like uncharacterized protein
MRTGALSLILLLAHVSHAQWRNVETLNGGAIATDMITFNSNLFAAFSYSGVFKSSDNGNTWAKTPVSRQGTFVYFIIHNNKLLALSSGASSITTDGVQWTEGAGPSATIRDIAVDGTNIYAACHDGIYYSSNGTSWTRFADPATHTEIKSIAVKGNTIWASSGYPDYGSLFRSVDGGASWTKIVQGTNPIVDIHISGSDVLIDALVSGILKSSNNGVTWEKVHFSSGGQFAASGSSLYYISPYRLYISTNGGNTWSTLGPEMPFFNAETLHVTDQHAFVGLWGGGIVRMAIPNTSAGWQFVNTGIAIHEVSDFQVYGSTIYTALRYSFIRTSADEGATWNQKTDDYNLHSDPRTVYHTGTTLFAGLSGGGVKRSTDNGATWFHKSNGVASGLILRFVRHSDAVFASAADGLYKSVDNGETWVKKNTGATVEGNILYSDGTNIYFGTYNGLFVSNDNGETWSLISTGLPDQFIRSVVHLESNLYVSGGAGTHRTSDLGKTWTLVTPKFVTALAVRNKHLLMATYYNEFLISDDGGFTTQNIAANLPPGVVNRIDFTSENIVISNGAGMGLWMRKIAQVFPPTLKLYSARTDNLITKNDPVYVEADQKLYRTAGTPLASADLSNYIAVKNSVGVAVAHTATIDAANKLITVNITNPVKGELYTVIVGQVQNETGLASQSISKSFRAVPNAVPLLSDLPVEGLRGKAIQFTKEMFSAAFSDGDNEPLAEVMIKSLPTHGVLKLNDVNVTVNATIDLASLDLLTFTPEATFVGEDQWSWNATDGIDYAVANAKVNVMLITTIWRETSATFTLYPNPVSSHLYVRFENDRPEDLTIGLFDLAGQEMKGIKILKESAPTVSVDVSEVPQGMYFIKAVSPSGNRYVRRIIKL